MTDQKAEMLRHSTTRRHLLGAGLKAMGGAALVGSATTTISGCGSSSANGQSSHNKLVLGVQPFISYAGIFIASEKDYFRNEGITVNLKMSRATGSALTTALVAGDYDITGAGLTAGFFSAAQRKVGIEIIASKGGNKGARSYTSLVVRKKLAQTGEITKVADLKGRRIGSASSGDANWIELIMLLEKAGIKEHEVKILNLDAPSRLDALRGGNIDAMIVSEPFVTAATEANVGKVLAPVGELGEYLEAVLITRRKYIQENSPGIKRFLRAYVKGVDDYLHDPDAKSNVAAIAKYTKQKDSTIRATTPFYIRSDATVKASNIREITEWLEQHQLLKGSIDVKSLFTNSLLPKA